MSSTIPSSSTIQKLSSLDQQDVQTSRVMDKVCRRSSVISGIFLATLALVFTIVLACGIVHPALIVSLVIVSVAILAIAIRSCRKEIVEIPLEAPIPLGFLNVVKQKYPQVIYDICVYQNLTIQELRDVISKVSQRNIPLMKTSKQIENFGAKKLLNGCQDTYLPPLDDILMKYCPLYFLKRFIELGPKEIPQKENLPPEIYWTARAALGDRYIVFSEILWLFSQTVTIEEYSILRARARLGLWDMTSDIVERVISRMKEKLPSIPDSIDKAAISADIDANHTLLRLCKHGMGWEQIQFIKKYGNPRHLGFLQKNERLGAYDSKLSKLMAAVYPYLDEDSRAYNASLALLTWKELKLGISNAAADFVSSDPIFYEAGIQFFNSRLKSSGIVLQPLPFSGEEALTLPTYAIDNVTGERLGQLS
ncbi:DUF1389 domain-containing protein [Chlamydia vaughanii]|uniref:DUF1389 domain-containing protein n=1 Tax=Chlamydia vaughanii TaxID=3112552 RepID=UPI0032B281F9